MEGLVSFFEWFALFYVKVLRRFVEALFVEGVVESVGEFCLGEGDVQFYFLDFLDSVFGAHPFRLPDLCSLLQL